MRTDYSRFLDVLIAIEDADRLEAWISVHFEDECDGMRLYGADLRILAEQYRKVEKERDTLQDTLDALKTRINDVLEDF